jgi:hypothetical protein
MSHIWSARLGLFLGGLLLLACLLFAWWRQ